jgi:hypothetical protein
MNQKQSGYPALRAATTMGAAAAHDTATRRARVSRPLKPMWSGAEEELEIDTLEACAEDEEDPAAVAATTPAAVTTVSVRGCHHSALDHSATARRGLVSDARADPDDAWRRRDRRLATHLSDSMHPSTEPTPEPTRGTHEM